MRLRGIKTLRLCSGVTRVCFRYGTLGIYGSQLGTINTSPFMLYLTLGSFTWTFISIFLYSSERPTPSSHFSCGQSLCLVFKTFPAHTLLKQFLCPSSNHSLTPLSSIDGGTVILQETTSITTTDNSVQFYLILFIQHQLATQSPQDALYFKLKMLQY